MPTRLLRWMRSKLSAITALTPSRAGPLAAQSRELPLPYSLPAKITSGTDSSLVAHGGVVDGQQLTRGMMDRPAALAAAGHVVAQADVGERAPQQHLVVAAPGAVGVEVGRLHAVLQQVAAGRAVDARSIPPGRCGRW